MSKAGWVRLVKVLAVLLVYVLAYADGYTDAVQDTVRLRGEVEATQDSEAKTSEASKTKTDEVVREVERTLAEE